MPKSLMKFILKLTPPNGFTSSPIAQRVPRLNHEALDHAVEEDVVVVPVGVNGGGHISCSTS